MLPGINSQAQDLELSSIGIGMQIMDLRSLISSVYYSSTAEYTQSFQLTINSGKFRFEPELGFATSKEKDETNGTEYKNSTVNAGVGFFLLTIKSMNVISFGIRGGYLADKQTVDYGVPTTSESKGSGYYFGPVIGGEHYFSNHFSIGSELQLRFSGIKIKTDNFGSTSEVKDSASGFRGVMTLRYYF